MSTMVEWIAAHALRLWALLLMLALLGGDLAWQHNVRRQRRGARLGHALPVWRWQGAAFLLLVLALFFGALALAIFERQPSALAGFDANLAESLHEQLPLPALHVIAVITHVGDTRSVALVAIVVLLVLLFRRHRQLALAWVVALFGVLPINESLKALFQRARPLHDHGFIREPGWSFPSGHAFGAMVFYGMLAYVLLRLSPHCHRTIIAAAIVLIGVVGISRIVLQVHYFSDVLAGYTAGAAWLVLCISASETRRKPM